MLFVRPASPSSLMCMSAGNGPFPPFSAATFTRFRSGTVVTCAAKTILFRSAQRQLPWGFSAKAAAQTSAVQYRGFMSSAPTRHTFSSKKPTMRLCAEQLRSLVFWEKPPGPSFAVSSTTFFNCLPGIQARNSLQDLLTRQTDICRSERRSLRWSEHSFAMRLPAQIEAQDEIVKALNFGSEYCRSSPSGKRSGSRSPANSGRPLFASVSMRPSIITNGSIHVARNSAAHFFVRD